MNSDKYNHSQGPTIHAHCPKCRHRQMFEKAQPRHRLHLLLSILTCGLWLVSWVAIYIGRRLHPWHCEHCGCNKPDFRNPPQSLGARNQRASLEALSDG